MKSRRVVWSLQSSVIQDAVTARKAWLLLEVHASQEIGIAPGTAYRCVNTRRDGVPTNCPYLKLGLELLALLVVRLINDLHPELVSPNEFTAQRRLKVADQIAQLLRFYLEEGLVGEDDPPTDLFPEDIHVESLSERARVQSLCVRTGNRTHRRRPKHGTKVPLAVTENLLAVSSSFGSQCFLPNCPMRLQVVIEVLCGALTLLIDDPWPAIAEPAVELA